MTAAIASYPQWKQEALHSVSKNGLNLTPLWATDCDIVRAAILNNPLAIRLAKPFQNNYRMAMLAVSLNGLAYLWISDELKKNQEIIKIVRKTLPRVYKGPKISHPQKRTVYYASSANCAHLKILSTFNDIFDALVPISLQAEECSMFLRDSRVILLNGTSLIPHLIYDTLYRQLLIAMLPAASLIDPVKGIPTDISLGKGYYTRNVIQAELQCYECRLPFRLAKTCIEGGNAYTFAINGRPFLLMGEASFYLSLIALENAAFFENKPYDVKKEPSEEAYRVVKNVECYFRFRRPIEESKKNGFCSDQDLAHFGGEFGYRTLLLRPISESEKPNYRVRAQQFEAFVRLTMERIAKDTGVSCDNIILFPQKFFHVDLDTFVTPDGEVVLHDDDRVITLLNHLLKTAKLTKAEEDLLNDYLVTATENSIRFKKAMVIRKERLKAKKIPYHLIPASFFSAKYKSHLNYCNGVFLRKAKIIKDEVSTAKLPDKGYVYLTTGPSVKEELLIHEKIKKLFSNLFPNYTLRDIPGLSNFVYEMHGGFRCMSVESAPAIEY